MNHCLHCRRAADHYARGLCRRCYDRPPVRRLYQRSPGSGKVPGLAPDDRLEELAGRAARMEPLFPHRRDDSEERSPFAAGRAVSA